MAIGCATTYPPDRQLVTGRLARCLLAQAYTQRGALLGAHWYLPIHKPAHQPSSQAVTFRVSEELHISFDRELTRIAAGKLTQVLLQDEWPSAPRDEAHDPEPPALDWDNISTSASETSLEPAHNSDNDIDYWNSDCKFK